MTDTINEIAALKVRLAQLEGAMLTTMKIPTTIDYLEQRLSILEVRMASIIAFAAASVETNASKKDEIFTRWSNDIAPALKEFASLKQELLEYAVHVPYWTQTHKDRI